VGYDLRPSTGGSEMTCRKYYYNMSVPYTLTAAVLSIVNMVVMPSVFVCMLAFVFLGIALFHVDKATQKAKCLKTDEALAQGWLTKNGIVYLNGVDVTNQIHLGYYKHGKK
jgi:hypothetical protein